MHICRTCLDRLKRIPNIKPTGTRRSCFGGPQPCDECGVKLYVLNKVEITADPDEFNKESYMIGNERNYRQAECCGNCEHALCVSEQDEDDRFYCAIDTKPPEDPFLETYIDEKGYEWTVDRRFFEDDFYDSPEGKELQEKRDLFDKWFVENIVKSASVCNSFKMRRKASDG